MTCSQRQTYFKATHPSPIDSTRKLFFFPEPASSSSQKKKKLALSPQRASSLINNVGTERSREHLQEVMSHRVRIYSFPLQHVVRCHEVRKSELWPLI